MGWERPGSKSHGCMEGHSVNFSHRVRTGSDGERALRATGSQPQGVGETPGQSAGCTGRCEVQVWGAKGHPVPLPGPGEKTRRKFSQGPQGRARFGLEPQVKDPQKMLRTWRTHKVVFSLSSRTKAPDKSLCFGWEWPVDEPQGIRELQKIA